MELYYRPAGKQGMYYYVEGYLVKINDEENVCIRRSRMGYLIEIFKNVKFANSMPTNTMKQEFAVKLPVNIILQLKAQGIVFI